MDCDKKVRIIGITGSIAAGKSLVAEIFRSQGAYIIDADILSREAVTPGSPGLARISETFGPNLTHPDGTLDRAALSEIVFNNPADRKKLEAILHPIIRQLFLEKLESARKDTREGQLIAYVVPLLFESQNKYPELEKIVVVSCDRETSIERIMQRDGSSRETAEKKVAAQLPIEEKEKLADIVIKNDSSLEELSKRATEVYSALVAG